MTAFNSSPIRARAGGARSSRLAGAGGIAVAALVALLLALVSSASAQPAEPADDAQWDVELEIALDDRTTAATQTEGASLSWTITPDHADCWIERGGSYSTPIYHDAQNSHQDSADLARTRSDGTTACAYTYTFPENEDGPWARWERYEWMGSPPNRSKVPYTGSYTVDREPCAEDPASDTDRCVPALTALYRRAAISRFEPVIAISVPATPADRYVGATFEVMFAQSGSTPTGCVVSGPATYEVVAGESVAQPMGDLPLLVHDPDTAAAGDTCSYTATFEATSDVMVGGSTVTLNNDGAMTETVTGADTTVTRTYSEPPMEQTFVPAVTVSVPQLDGTAGTNIWSGTELEVEIARDVASESITGCDDAATPVAVTFTVQDDGSVMPDATEMPASLDGTTTASETCGYTVTFGDVAAPAASADLIWALTTPAEATLSNVTPADNSATGAYALAGEVTFNPAAEITVPAGSDGKSFAVSVTSATTGCSGNPTAVTLTYAAVDAAATTAAADSGNAPLIAYQSTATASTDVCAYTAEFPMNEVEAGTTLVRQAAPAPDTTFTGTDQGISATYAAAPVPSGGDDGERLPPPVGTTVVAPGTAPTISATSASGLGIGSDIADDDDEDAFAGFVASPTERVPISVSLTLPEVAFDVDATVELLVSSPGACGSDMAAFGGVPAQVGLAYAVGATSGATADVIAAGAQTLAQFAERGTQQEPCALRVTVLAAPDGCTLAGGAADSEGRSYAELTWSTGTEALALTTTLTCGGTATEGDAGTAVA